MKRIPVAPTRWDRQAARAIAAYTNPELERAARAVAWCADEKLMLGLAASLWIASRWTRRNERQATHILACTAAAAVLPHVLKRLLSQRRPDRIERAGRVHGVRYSGRATDAFPSGHAVHVGAIVSAMAGIYPRSRGAAWLAGLLVCATRVLTLAHWPSDVLAGLAMGIGIERALRSAFAVPSSKR